MNTDWTVEELEGASIDNIVVMLNEYADMVAQLQEPVPYTHRNGERDEPTEGNGWYWIDDPMQQPRPYIVYWNSNYRAWQPSIAPSSVARIYGPIPQPIRKEIPHG